MKNVDNNEMELALRALAKGARQTSLSAAGGFSDVDAAAGDHLDADELNSYAEGLVPEAARSRYTEHLADCTNCRSILISLTHTREPALPALVSEPASGPGFWEKIAGFLSLPAVRFGVPALVLTAVIAIGLLALRQEPGADMVAQRQPEPTPSVVPNTTGTAPTQAPPAEAAQNSSTELAREPVASGTPALGLKSTQPSVAPAPKIAVAPGASTSDSVATAPSKAAEPPPPPAPATVSALPTAAPSSNSKFGGLVSGQVLAKDASKSEDKKSEQPERREAQPRARDDNQYDSSREAEEDNAALRANTASGPRRAEGWMSERGAAARKSKRESTDEDDTRSVGGRRFRRDGSTWVDTAYQTPRATISVKRGSEQFRALVADEPGIRTIADALTGDVIVVWKRKAYRIR